jgi:hypothetical protein
MTDWIGQLSGGQVTSVKIVLTSVLAVLAIYQVCLASVFYGKVRVPFLAGRVAAITHRSSGDAIFVVIVLIGLMCVSGYEVRDAIEHRGARVAAHVVISTLLVVVLSAKIVVLRFGRTQASRFLPYIGSSVFLLLLGSWATSSLFFFRG